MFIESDPALARLFSEAGFGSHMGGKTLFSPLEAGYLVKIGKSSFKGLSLLSFCAEFGKEFKDFEFALSVYFQIRSSGRILVPAGKSSSYFRVYAPGVGRAEGRPHQLLLLLPGERLSPKSISSEIAAAHLERLELIIATGNADEPKFNKISSYNF